jgi:hypothetical protein
MNYKRIIIFVFILLLIFATIFLIINNKNEQKINEEKTKIETEKSSGEILLDVTEESGEQIFIEDDDRPLSDRILSLNELKNSRLLLDDNFEELYKIKEYTYKDGFSIIQQDDNNYQEIAIMELDEEQKDSDALILSCVARYEKIKSENQGKYSGILTNIDCFNISKQGNVIIFILSKNKDKIEQIINDYYFN